MEGKQAKVKIAKSGIRVIIALLLLLLAVVAGYVVYLLVSYDRIPDHQPLLVQAPGVLGDGQEIEVSPLLQTGETYRAVTYNIGFGAYTPEFSFFMDGGISSWAESKDSVLDTVTGAASLIASFEPDFALIQEIDLDATRSYHVDEYDLIKQEMPAYYSVFAVNYDSAFLMYPFTQPHGKSYAGLALLSRYGVSSAERRSFPISTSLSKFFDLDRCYSISRIPVENGKELVIINLHMSAYGNSDAIREGQIRMLCEDMQREYEAGNYVLCGGDFNHDLKVLTDDGTERASWAYPFPRENLPKHFSFAIDSMSETDREALWNTARNADMPYIPGETYTVTLDGFLLSDNITIQTYDHINTAYTYSDHDPVLLTFQLNP